jgi:hypothetical protein
MGGVEEIGRQLSFQDEGMFAESQYRPSDKCRRRRSEEKYLM